MRRHSCIYEGVVRHRRHAPRPHAFSYRLFLMYLDLDELPRLFDGTPLWSVRHPAPAWFRRGDYLGDPHTPLEVAIRELVSDRLGERPSGPVRVLTNMRYLGYCFNPVSFYWCFDRSGTGVASVVAEVTNTPWGERRMYVARELTSHHRKMLHVSPFWPMEMDYELRIGLPGERLNISIRADREGVRAFDAGLALVRREITPAALNGLLVRYPAMTARVSAAIYSEALRLWLKGVRRFPHPEAIA